MAKVSLMCRYTMKLQSKLAFVSDQLYHHISHLPMYHPRIVSLKTVSYDPGKYIYNLRSRRYGFCESISHIVRQLLTPQA